MHDGYMEKFYMLQITKDLPKKLYLYKKTYTQCR